MRRIGRWGWVSILAILLLTAINAFQFEAAQERERERPIRSLDEDYVARTIQIYAEEKSISAEQLMKLRFPVSMTINHETCVELRLKRSVLGRSFGACFSRATGQMSRTFAV